MPGMRNCGLIVDRRSHWNQRRPTRVDAATEDSTPALRLAWYLDQIDRLRADLIALSGRIDPQLDPSTTQRHLADPRGPRRRTRLTRRQPPVVGRKLAKLRTTGLFQPEAFDLATRRPVIVTTVRPPLERVEVVRARFDHLAERLIASAQRPGDGAGDRSTSHPSAIQRGVQRTERSRLPDVHIFVVGDQLGTPRTTHVACAVDHIAHRDGEVLADHQPAAVHMSVLAVAQRVGVPGVGLQCSDSVRDSSLRRSSTVPTSSRARMRRHPSRTTSHIRHAFR